MSEQHIRASLSIDIQADVAGQRTDYLVDGNLRPVYRPNMEGVRVAAGPARNNEPL